MYRLVIFAAMLVPGTAGAIQINKGPHIKQYDGLTPSGGAYAGNQADWTVGFPADGGVLTRRAINRELTRQKRIERREAFFERQEQRQIAERDDS